MTSFDVDRRRFIKMGAISAGALTLGLALAGCSDRGRASGQGSAFRPNGWLSVKPNGSVEIMIAKSELGQGVMTSLAVLVAEELDADWKCVSVSHAPLDIIYGSQMTGGSTSIRQGWTTLRQAGAIARKMLCQAASSIWGVPESECRNENGFVIHSPSRRRLGYGDLVTRAAALPVPDNATLKNPTDFRLVGTSLPRLDIPSMVDGSAVFTADIELPGMLTATVIHCPEFGGRLARVDPRPALDIDGVTRVVELDSAVAVVANGFWSASEGAQRLSPEWDLAGAMRLTEEDIWSRLQSAMEDSAEPVRRVGDPLASIASARRLVTAEYALPFQAHATMEPMCCIARMLEGQCEVWAPTQSPWEAYHAAAQEVMSPLGRFADKVQRRISGRGDASVRVHTVPAGGGFGRRLEQDYVTEAVRIATAVGAPVKLIWSRQEDMQHDFYRPVNLHRLSVVLDEQGWPVAWEHRIAGPGVSREGSRPPYSIPNQQLFLHDVDVGVPTGPWRSTAHSFNAFAVECLIDELAATAGHNPLQYRLTLLNEQPRLRRVLQIAADKAGWGSPLRTGHALGVAVHPSKESYVAQIAEVSVEDPGVVRVHRVVCVVDCGMVINPDTVAAQIEGAIVFGMTATLKSGISIEAGRVRQTNFDDFPLLRMDEMPVIETHIVPSAEPPGGIGEPGVPPIAPAVSNAVRAATGFNPRTLPIAVGS